MKFIPWIVRALLFISLSIKGAAITNLYSTYEKQVLLVQSAPQASELSAEQMLASLGLFSFLFITGIIWIAFEIGLNTYYLRKKITLDKSASINEVQNDSTSA